MLQSDWHVVTNRSPRARSTAEQWRLASAAERRRGGLVIGRRAVRCRPQGSGCQGVLGVSATAPGTSAPSVLACEEAHTWAMTS